jgi:hypothetical protein
MGKFKIVGCPISEFDEMLKSASDVREVEVREARLIPAMKKIDELFLASVFLSSLTLIKEFRAIFSKEIGLSRAGSIRAYTEVSFPKLKVFNENNMKKGPLRIDGMLLQIANGVIRDAALFEMKMGSNELEENQIVAYQNIAREMGIKRLITISNQFVPSPKCCPLNISKVKDVDLYHFSWRNILVMGSILLTDNDLNISDPDQVNIMKEVMAFFRHPYAGISTFDSMGKGWMETVDGIRANSLNKDSVCMVGAIQDWLEEEQDLALKLSDSLGLMIDCNKRQYSVLQERIDAEKKFLFQNRYLESQFKIRNAVSPMTVQADFSTRRIRCIIEVSVPQDKKTAAARLNWLNKQLEGCKQKKALEKEFTRLESKIWLDPVIKGHRATLKEPYSQLEKLLDSTKNYEIKAVRISLEEDLGGKFSQSRKFIEEYEKTVFGFYNCIVQNVKNWEEPAPKMDIKKASPMTQEEVSSESIVVSSKPATEKF